MESQNRRDLWSCPPKQVPFSKLHRKMSRLGFEHLLSIQHFEYFLPEKETPRPLWAACARLWDPKEVLPPVHMEFPALQFVPFAQTLGSTEMSPAPSS